MSFHICGNTRAGQIPKSGIVVTGIANCIAYKMVSIKFLLNRYKNEKPRAYSTYCASPT